MILYGIWLGALAPAQAQTVNVWTNLAGGYWESPANWSAGAPASLQSLLLITNAGTKTIRLFDGGVPDSVKTISNLVVSASTGSTNTLQLETITGGINQFAVLNSLTLQSGGELLISSFITGRVDGVSGGALDVDGSVRALNGVLITTNASTHIGRSSNGTMLIDGAQWLARDVALGYLLGGNGTLTVASGSATLSGELRIAPAASSAGTLLLNGGQLNTTNANAYIGLYGNASGSMTVSTNALWRARDVYVGYYGGSQGYLALSGGTNMISNSLTLGDSLNATGRVYATAGLLVVTNAAGNAKLTVGRNGYGSLHVSGATVVADQLIATNGWNSSFFMERGTLTTRSTIASNLLQMSGEWRMVGGSHQLTTLSAPIMYSSPATLWVTDAQLSGNIRLGGNRESTMTVSNTSWTSGSAEVGQPETSRAAVLSLLDSSTTLDALVVGKDGVDNHLFVSGGQLNVRSLKVGNPSYGGFGYGYATFSNTIWRADSVMLVEDIYGAGSLALDNSTGIVTNSLQIAPMQDTAGTVGISGGLLAVTNATGSASIVVGGRGNNYGGLAGSLSIGSGTICADQLVVTNASSIPSEARGILNFSGGRLSTGGAVFRNGKDLSLGASNFPPAVWDLHDGLHTIENVPLRIAAEPTSAAAAVLISGQLITTNNVPVYVGDAGAGQMTISNGAWLAQTVVVGRSNGALGTLTLAGGNASISSNLTLGSSGCGAAGAVAVAGGQLWVTNATHDATLDVRSGTLTLNYGLLSVDCLILTNACGRISRLGGTLLYSSLILDTNLSATGDGLPNWWKQKYGFDPLSSLGDNGPNADPDHDGMSNLAEYMAGSDPTSGNSYLHITAIKRVGNDIQVNWNGYGPRTNQLQATTGSSLEATNDFRDIGTPFILSAPRLYRVSSTDLGAATNKSARFYRVRVVQ